MKKELFMAASAIVLLAACNNNDEALTSKNGYKPQISNEFAMSNDEAKSVLSFFVNDGATTRSDGKILTVKDYKVRNIEVMAGDNTEIVPVYEYTTVNENGDEGYAIVVGDERISKVLVQVEKGSLADTIDIEPLKWYINSIPSVIKDDLSRYKANIKVKPISGGTRDSYVETHYCFLPTTWGQWGPYNLQCPVDTIDNVVLHCPAGCAPVAVAQILAYHRVPTTLSWTSILQSQNVTSSSPSTVISQVSNLIATLGTQLSTVYSLNGSPSTLNLIPSVLYSYSLYNNGIYTFSLDDVIYNLGNNHPVIMIGKTPVDPETGTRRTHMWVCDGWKRHHYDTVYYDYLDMNWGWNGNSNGFYYISNPMTFSTNIDDIVQDFQMITGIH